MSDEHAEFQRKMDEFARATSQLIVPNGARGLELLAKVYEGLLARTYELGRLHERNAKDSA